MRGECELKSSVTATDKIASPGMPLEELSDQHADSTHVSTLRESKQLQMSMMPSEDALGHVGPAPGSEIKLAADLDAASQPARDLSVGGLSSELAADLSMRSSELPSESMMVAAEADGDDEFDLALNEQEAASGLRLSGIRNAAVRPGSSFA